MGCVSARYRALARRERFGGVSGVVAEVPELFAAQQHRGQEAVRQAGEDAELEAALEVAGLVQLTHHGRLADLRVVARERLRGVEVAEVQRVVELFGCDGPADDRVVRAFDLRDVQEACAAADQEPAGEGELGDREVAAFVEGPGAVLDALAAFEVSADRGVCFPALELLVGVEVGVAVVEADDEAEVHEVGRLVVHEGAAVHVVRHRPADRVLHQSRLQLFLGHLPDLFVPDAVRLLVAARSQVELPDRSLGQRAPAALRKHHLLRAQLDPALERVLRLPVLVDARVCSRHADHTRALLVEEQLVGREAREHVDPSLLRPLAHPAAQPAQADDVVSSVVDLLGQQQLGHAEGPALEEYLESVSRDFLRERRFLLR